MRVAVIGVQGAVSEHLDVLARAFSSLRIKGEAVWVKDGKALSECDGLVIPGGESTTISRLMSENGLFEAVKELNARGAPILGTCAGMILLAKKARGTAQGGQALLGLMDFEANRNAFGRQRESFETMLQISFLEKNKPFRGVFIRAPSAEKVWGAAKIVSRLGDGTIVGVEQKNLLALAFHPELAGDARVHEYFLKMV